MKFAKILAVLAAVILAAWYGFQRWQDWQDEKEWASITGGGDCMTLADGSPGPC